MAKVELTVDLTVSGDDVLSLIMVYLANQKGQRVALLNKPEQAYSNSGKARRIDFIGLLQGREGGFETALRNRNLLRQMASEIGYQDLHSGLILPAYHEKELALLEALALSIGSFDPQLSILTPEQTVSLSPFLSPIRLEGSLYIPGEINLDADAFCRQAYHYLIDHPNVVALPREEGLQWKEPYLEGSDFRVHTQKIFIRRRMDRIPLAFGGPFQLVQREIGITVDKVTKGPAVQIGWVQNPPAAFSILPAYKDQMQSGYLLQPPGHLHLIPDTSGRLSLHQSSPVGDPGEARLFAALRKCLRTFPEEDIIWDSFWKSEKDLTPFLPQPSKTESQSFFPDTENSRLPDRLLFPLAEDFLTQQGSGLFQS